MLANCDRCELRDIACADCVITALPDGQAGLGEAERRALRVLAEAGLLPPLRYAAPAAPIDLASPTDLVGRTRNTSTRRPRRHRIQTVKTRPSVSEAVETALALH